MAKELNNLVEQGKDLGYEGVKYGIGWGIAGVGIASAVEAVGRVPVFPPIYEALTAGLGPIPEAVLGFVILAGGVAVKDRFVDRFVAHHAPPAS